MDIKNLKAEILAGNRRSIAKGITLLESQKEEHIQFADELLTSLMPHTGKSLRIGVSGIPGVGKSSFIENFGNLIIEKGMKIAVLAIDPSSLVSGGSILGDKTRMEILAANESSFIRPSPTTGNLGGVARKTREISLLMEAAGYDVVLIETVGVGQSETVVSSMVDMFLVLQMPKTGDELQGIKKGILEVADLILINKADNELLQAAKNAQKQHEQALAYLKSFREKCPKVLLTSTADKECYLKVWQEIEEFVKSDKESGHFVEKRAIQRGEWFDREVSQIFLETLSKNTSYRKTIEQSRNQVLTNKVPASISVRNLLKKILPNL